MAQKKASSWASFPPDHKKRFFQGVFLYVLAVAAVAGWISVHAGESMKDWESRIPYAEIELKVHQQQAAVIQTDPVPPPPPVIPEEVPEEKIEGPTISLIISGLGLSQEASDRAIDDLPAAVALAFSPYSTGLAHWLPRAAKAGKETLLLLPMEPSAYPKEDPGPEALLSRLGDAENTAHLSAMLARAPGVVGVMNFMGAQFLNDRSKLSPVFALLGKTDPIFIETPSATTTAAAEVAEEHDLPYIAADIAVDSNATDSAIRQQLLELEKLALSRGYALGVASPYPVTLGLIQSWAETLESRGIKLIPLTSLWKRKIPYAQETNPQILVVP